MRGGVEPNPLVAELDLTDTELEVFCESVGIIVFDPSQKLSLAEDEHVRWSLELIAPTREKFDAWIRCYLEDHDLSRKQAGFEPLDYRARIERERARAEKARIQKPLLEKLRKQDADFVASSKCCETCGYPEGRGFTCICCPSCGVDPRVRRCICPDSPSQPEPEYVPPPPPLPFVDPFDDDDPKERLLLLHENYRDDYPVWHAKRGNSPFDG